MGSTPTDKNSRPTARQVAASIKALGGRLEAVIDKLDRAGDAPVPAGAARELEALAAAMRQAVEPTPPSATTEKQARSWPADMAASDEADPAQAPLWGSDPEGLRRG